tara:strand:- start:142 stop:294 length:153 start_codon:yes stop_codon:yes gene_type:complete
MLTFLAVERLAVRLAVERLAARLAVERLGVERLVDFPRRDVAFVLLAIFL